MIGPRNVHPDELGDAEGMVLQDALRVANRLVEAMDDLPIPTGEPFVDGVMAALANEPTPGPTGFLVPLRRRGIIAGLGESFRQAWASVGSGRPALGRSAALAYVLAVVIAGVSLTGAATLGAAGALGLLGSTPTQSPAPPTPGPTVAPPTAPSIIAPPSSDEVLPTEAPTPSPTEPDDDSGPDDDGDGSGPGAGADGSDDGDNSGPGGGDDSGAGGGGNSGPGSSGSGSGNSGPGSDDSGSSGSSDSSGSGSSGSKD